MAGGAEERHVSSIDSTLLGPWGGSTVYIAIDGTTKYTGAASFIFKVGAQGSSPQSSQGAKGWWSYAAYLPAYGNGTYRVMWSLGSSAGGVVTLGWAKGSSVNEHKIRLVTATGTYTSTAEFTQGQWHRVKVEFDAGVWTIWASDNGAAWTTALSRDDSGTYTALSLMHMNIVYTTDETKVANQWYRADDVHFWDPTGDNWNSRITATADFPRISAAHMPNTVAPKTESHAGQAALLDEIPPTDISDNGTGDVAVSTDVGPPGTLTDTREAWGVNVWAGYVVICNGQKMTIASNTATVLTGGTWTADPGDEYAWFIVTDKATIDEANYWTDVEDFKPTGETIQAVMVTRVDAARNWANLELKKFNVREGGVLYPDSEEGGLIIQWGSSSASIAVTYAGYYPWTPGEINWTELIFEACQYGCSLVSGETDQITAQAIYFGSSHEWEPPVGAVYEDLSGTIVGTSTLAGVLTRKRALSGPIAGVGALSASLSRKRPLSGTIAGQATFAAALTRWRGLGGTIAAVSDLSGRLFVVWYLQGVIAAISVLSGSLTVQRRAPLLADAIARAEHLPTFGDAWQQPKEPPDG